MKISISLTVIMAGSIKLFQSVQKFNKTMGLDILHQRQFSKNHLQFNLSAKLIKSLFFILSTMQLFISSTAFFLIKAQTSADYGISFYVSLTTFCVLINFVTVAWRMDNILTLINRYEKFIGKS